MKLLFIGNVGYRFNAFALSSSIAANELNMEFHIAGSWTGYDNWEEKLLDEQKYGIKIHQIDFIRSPYDPRNIKAYKQIVKLIQEEQFDVIHCNTPIGGVVGRLAGRKCNIKPVIYQAHGLHFYKGAPILNWLLFYPIEKWMAHYTDAIITINSEDFERAQKKFHLRDSGNIYYVPGVGIDIAQFESNNAVREEKRNEIGIPLDSNVIISIGDLNKNKNNGVIIEALKRCNSQNFHFVLCGDGPLKEQLAEKARPIIDKVHFLGYRTDVKDLLAAADIFVMPSLREGLSRSLMEAMASGIPCVVSRIRGNVDLVKEEEGGFLLDPKDVEAWRKALDRLISDKELRKKFGKNNKVAVEAYSLPTAVESIKKVYRKVIMPQ